MELYEICLEHFLKVGVTFATVRGLSKRWGTPQISTPI